MYKILVSSLIVALFYTTNSAIAGDLKERHGRSMMARERTAEALEKNTSDKAMAQLRTNEKVSEDRVEEARGESAKLEARHGRAKLTRELALGAGKSN